MHARWQDEKAAHGHLSFYKFKTHLGKIWKMLPAQEKEAFLDTRGGRRDGFVTETMRAELKAHGRRRTKRDYSLRDGLSVVMILYYEAKRGFWEPSGK